MGAVFFIAAIFPGTLLPMSTYALVRSAAAVMLSPALGSWIDKGDRLKVVRVSIVGQRLAVGASCGIFWILYERKELGTKLRVGLSVVNILLACIEKLCSVLNLVSVERDWVVSFHETMIQLGGYLTLACAASTCFANCLVHSLSPWLTEHLQWSLSSLLWR